MFITTIYVVKVYKLSVGDANPFGTKTFYFMNQNDKETFLDYLNDAINMRCFRCSYTYTLYLIIKEHFDRKSLESYHVIYDMLCALSAFDKDHLRSMEVVHKLKNGEAI